MKIPATACLLLITLSAAAAPPRALPPSTKVNVESEYYLHPAKGATARAEIGEPLYDEGVKRLHRTYRATLGANVTAKLDNGYNLDLRSGNRGQIAARPGQDENMLCFPTTAGGFMTFMAGGTVRACLVDSDNDLVFDHAQFDGYSKQFALSAPTPYSVEVSESRTIDQDSLQVQVLYQGLSKGEVKFSFREFKDGLARPAFTQDIAYEIGADGRAVVGFKGMRLVVTQASNTEVTYMIEQPVTSLAKYRAEAAALKETTGGAWWKPAPARAQP